DAVIIAEVPPAQRPRRPQRAGDGVPAGGQHEPDEQEQRPLERGPGECYREPRQQRLRRFGQQHHGLLPARLNLAKPSMGRSPFCCQRRSPNEPPKMAKVELRMTPSRLTFVIWAWSLIRHSG